MDSVIFLTILSFYFVDGYNILYATTLPSQSHRRLSEGFLRPLLERGHKITYIHPYNKGYPHPNVTEIKIDFIFDSVDPAPLNISKLRNAKQYNSVPEWMGMAFEFTQMALLHDNVQNFINDPEQNFDLIIVDWLYNDLLMGFSALYQCPLIISSSFDAHSGIISLVDGIMNPAYTDNIMTSHDHPFGFMERVQMLWELSVNYWNAQSLRPKYIDAYQKAFKKAAAGRGVTMPSYDDLIYNTSMVFLNAHPSYTSSCKLPQNVVNVGGYFIQQPPPPLPKDIQKIMDEAEHGVIYFSLGSNAKSKDMPSAMKRSMLKMFSELKQTVLWKFEEDLNDLPNNVYIRKWMPQCSILAHPNLKMFVSHGGMLSTTEATHFGVSMVAIPLFGDQFSNVKRGVRNGNIVKVDLTDNLAADLKVAIEKILLNTSYTEAARRISHLYHDRPMPAREELVYWLEYVVRTGGAPHLRSKALLVPWYKRTYLDLLALVIAGITALIFLLKSAASPRKESKKKTL